MSTITDNVLAFTETVGSYGYETMVYSYKDALSYYLDMGKLEGKLIWLAHWVNKTDYKGTYHMWQYSDAGRVDGIKTNVDLNISSRPQLFPVRVSSSSLEQILASSKNIS